MTLTGAVSRVAHFTTADGKDPIGKLVAAPGGIFYGVTSRGGTNDAGTVFRASTNGTLTTLASFGGAHGQYPNSLILGSDGSLYGITFYGPVTNDGGRVFKITTAGTLTTFANLAPLGIGQPLSLLQASDGFFYGSALAGIFRVSTNGTASVVAPLSASPSPLVQASDGHLYFTTYSGGTGAEGTVMRATRDGIVSTIVDFAGKPGLNPLYGLTLGPDGLLHGILTDNGHGYALIFRVTLGGYFTSLYDLETAPAAVSAGDLESALTFGPGGNLYGVASSGLYRLTQLPPLLPYAQTGPADSVTETGAALNGEVFTGGGSVAVFFDYGLTTNYGQTITATPALVSGASPVAVRASLTSLSPRTVYHYRVRAGTTNGQDATFRTGPLPTTLAEALNAPGLNWTTSPANPWFLQTAVTFDGEAAAQSGGIGDNGSTELASSVTGPGTLTFRWKVSSEEGYDYLRFYIDGVQQALIDGETDWQQITRTITNGNHTITWRYTKDESSSEGADAGWVDTVTWEPQGQILITQFTRLPGVPARYRLIWSATPGHRYAIETSNGSFSWNEVPGTQRTAVAAQESVDLEPGNNPPPASFYRVHRLP
jgi:uncharacterized repeat protein (TIGR03803 family)